MRVERAFGFLLGRHAKAVIIGTDSPELRGQTLLNALSELRWCHSVLGPCPDGGYYLIGLRREAMAMKRTLLRGIRWGTEWALADTMRNLLSAGLSCSLLSPERDVDLPKDLFALRGRMRRQVALRRRAPATWRFLRQL